MADQARIRESFAGRFRCSRAHGAAAQSKTYPAYPIKIIVPFAAGGGVDASARLLAKQIEEKHGKSIVIENRAGANGTVGASGVLQSQPDGYMLLFSAATHVMALQVMSKSLRSGHRLHPDCARRRSADAGGHVSAETTEVDRRGDRGCSQEPRQVGVWCFRRRIPRSHRNDRLQPASGTKFTIVPYRGTAPALTDVTGGHIQLMIDPVIALLPMALGRSSQGAATTTAKRSQLTPDIPTAAESGMPGLEFSSWYGLWGRRTCRPRSSIGSTPQWPTQRASWQPWDGWPPSASNRSTKIPTSSAASSTGGRAKRRTAEGSRFQAAVGAVSASPPWWRLRHKRTRYDWDDASYVAARAD